MGPGHRLIHGDLARGGTKGYNYLGDVYLCPTFTNVPPRVTPYLASRN